MIMEMSFSIVLGVLVHVVFVQSQPNSTWICWNGGECVGQNICQTWTDQLWSCTTQCCNDGERKVIVEELNSRCPEGYSGPQCRIGPIDPEVTATPPTIELGPSASPRNPRAVGVSTSHIAMAWDTVDPLEANGEITMYKVMYLPTETPMVEIDPVTIGQGISHLLTAERVIFIGNLSELTNYTLFVRAHNADSAGPFTRQVVATTLGATTLQAMTLEATTLEFTTGEAVSITMEALTTEEFTTLESTTMEATTSESESTTFETTTAEATTLEPESTTAEATALEEITTGALLPEVTNITVSTLTATSVTVYWEVEDGLLDTTLWIVYYTRLDSMGNVVDGSERSVAVPASIRSLRISRLRQGVDYVFEVAGMVEINGTMIIGSRFSVTATIESETGAMTSAKLFAISGGVFIGVIGVTILLMVALMVFIMSSARVKKSKEDEKDFKITMNDIIW